MLSYARRGLLRRTTTSAQILALALSPAIAAAQDSTTYLDPPKGEAAIEYEASLPRALQNNVDYIDETDIDLITAETRPEPRVTESRRATPPALATDSGVFIVVLVIGLLLFLFLKYGGAGGLFQSDPNAEQRPKKRAKAWGLTASEESPSDILSKIRAMASRRDALILLLRHCLLQASDETDIHFLRSDTEREALGRLPSNWRRFKQLTSLLRSTELVHYGGRDISDDEFEAALGFGAQILMEAR